MLVNFGDRLRRLRESRGFSLRQLESASGVHFTTLSRYENISESNARVSVQELRKLAVALETSLDDLFDLNREQATGSGLRAKLRNLESRVQAATELLEQSRAELHDIVTDLDPPADELATRRRRRDSGEEQYDPAELARTKAEIQERTAASTWPDEPVTEEARQEMDTKAAQAVIRVSRRRGKQEGKDGSGGASEGN